MIESAVKGDREAFRLLVARYQAKVLQLCFQTLRNRTEAEDAAQEVFVQMFRSLGDYRMESSFQTWMRRVALNKCLDLRRKQSRRSGLAPHVPLRDDIPKRSHELTPEEALIDRETQLEVHRAIEALPAKYRDVVTLFYLHQLTHQEIASQLDIEVKSVATRLYRAKKMMEEQLRKEAKGHDDEPRRGLLGRVLKG